MAVKQPKLAKDFWPHASSVALTVALLFILISTGALAGILFAFGFYDANQFVFFMIILAQLFLSTVASLVLYSVLASPLKAVMAAITHVSGERSETPPPNPNTARFEKTGFKDVLQTVYSLASTDKPAAQSKTTPETAVASQSVSQIVESALNEARCGFVVMDTQRRITFANKAAPVDINKEGKSELTLIFNGSDTLDAWLAQCEQSAVRAEKTWTRIANKLPESENRRLFDVIASYVKGAESEVVLTLVDRTDIYLSGEQELDFIAFAAHELRGPITVIRGYLDVLQDELKPVLEADHVELFRRLTVSANRLSGYINNILNTSRYDRRHLRVHLEEVSVSSIFDMIRDDMNLRATSQGRLLTIAVNPDLPKIAGDPASLSEVFGNLIDNAIKYSNEGGVINVTAAARDGAIDVLFEDHGIGMPGNVVSNLFQKFYRSHRSRETVAGTGIGLYISKAIIESHGGSISVRSEEGRGSVFTVSLPTYASVAEKLKAGDNSNEGLIEQNSGWIKNHSMYRG